MGLSIPVIAREHADFINRELDRYERELNPASVEDAEAVRRAVFSVRNKSVLFERFNPATNKLFTVVQDVRPAEVTVDFSHELMSCTCPQDLCRHKLGVLLGLFQFLGSVQEWRARWTDKKTVQLSTLATERTPEAWQRMVDEVMNHLLPAKRRVESYLVTSFLENAHAKLRRYMPLEREWQPIYKLYIELAILNKIWAHFIETDSPITSDYFEYAMDRRYSTAIHFIEELDKSRLFATDPFYDAIQMQLRQLLLQPKGGVEVRLSFYLSCWEHLFYDTKRAQVELSMLTTEIETDMPVEVLRLVPLIVLKDEAAITEHLQHILIEEIEVYKTIVHYALAVDAPLFAEMILKAILPSLPRFIQQILPPAHRQRFIVDIHPLYTQISLSENQELQLFNAFGRYGVQPYSDYLLRHERFEEWVALHQLYKSSVPYLDSIGLKTVIAKEPATVLPLYHAYAMEEVAQKSRMNYKQAVRIWKQMKAAAKKAGKMTYFEDYIEQVRAQFKRLRALQEELDKANLRGEKQ